MPICFKISVNLSQMTRAASACSWLNCSVLYIRVLAFDTVDDHV